MMLRMLSSFVVGIVILHGCTGQQCGLEFSQLQDCIMKNAPTPPSAPEVDPRQIQSRATNCLLQAGCQNPFTQVKDATLEKKKRKKRQATKEGGQPKWPRRRFPPLTPPPNLDPRRKPEWEKWAAAERKKRREYFRKLRQNRQAAERAAEAKAKESEGESGQTGPAARGQQAVAVAVPRVQFSGFMQRVMKTCKDRVVDSEIKPELVRCLKESGKLPGFKFPSSSGNLGSSSKSMEKHINAKIQLNLLVQLAGRVIEPGFCNGQPAQRQAENCLENLGNLLSPKEGCKNPVEAAFDNLKLHQQTCSVFTQCKQQNISPGCQESFDTAYQAICECGTKMSPEFLQSVAVKMNTCLQEEEENLPERVTPEVRLAALQTMIAASQKDFTVQFCVVKTIPDPCKRMKG